MAPVPVPAFTFERPHERPWGWFAFSLVFHALLIGALVWEALDPFVPFAVDTRTPGGPGPAGGGGGGGARRITYVELPAYQPPRAEREEEQRPVQELEIPVPEIAKVEVPPDTVKFEIARTDSVPIGARVIGEGSGSGGGPGAGTGTGGGVGSGRGTGIGSGVGPGTGGEGGEIFPPAPRYTILPPQPRPKSVQGKTFQAKITVGPDGRVLAVDIRPEIRDGDYRRRLIAQLYEWAFQPAVTRDGIPVRGETVITLTL